MPSSIDSLNQHAVIAACGAVTALGAGVEHLRHAVLTGTSALRPCERPGDKGCQSLVAGWVPDKLLARLRAGNPSQADARAFLLADAALAEAERSAGTALHAVPSTRRGLVLSTTKADIEAMERVFRHQACSSSARRHIQPALLAADLATARRISGPIQCVSAACISGLLAIQQGASLIQRGAADLVFVIGVDLVSPFVLAGFTTLKSLDPNGCRPFDRSRIGLSLGEGAGALLLARADIWPSATTRVCGWGTSNDANHLTGPSRDGAGLALAISRALAKAGAAPASIDYIHLHGTGTPYNDAMESLALRSVFGSTAPPCGSSKGILGHTLGAAGLLETIICELAFDARTMPGTPRLRERDPAAPESMLTDARPNATLRHILKVNCGFGGTNAAVVLENLTSPSNIQCNDECESGGIRRTPDASRNRDALPDSRSVWSARHSRALGCSAKSQASRESAEGLPHE